MVVGGFARIYTVKLKPDDKPACLKRVIVKEKSDLNQLRNEVDTMKRLTACPYIVRYYDSNAEKLADGTYEVLVLMELCSSGSLLDYMNANIKTKLDVGRITKIMYQITTALDYMHSKNLIHRDLKIENVLRDSNGVFKLADFGSASSFMPPPKNQEEVQMVAADIIRNTTPQYRAPEMIDLYKSLPIDNKSDMWALGVFLYKLMYYTTPFESQGELAILHGYFQFPETMQYPSRLKNLVIIMLQVNPIIRPNAYQVLYEICDMMGVPVPIEDHYGLGRYEFSVYEKYQKHVQRVQQEQLELEQRYLMRRHQEQNTGLKVEPQVHPDEPNDSLQVPNQYPNQIPSQIPSVQPVTNSAPNGVPSAQSVPKSVSNACEKSSSIETTKELEPPMGEGKSFESDAFVPLPMPPNKVGTVDDGIRFSDIQPQELSQSSKSSVRNLPLDREEESSSDSDLENVEDRFPDLDQLDALDDMGQGVDKDYISAAVLAAKSDKLNIKGGQTKEPSNIAAEHGDTEPSGPSDISIKLSKTEAWTISEKETNNKEGHDKHDDTDADVDVFLKSPVATTITPASNDLNPTKCDHSESNASVLPELSVKSPEVESSKIERPSLIPKNSFDQLFDFEDSSAAQQTPREASLSRNPFPTGRNPFPVKTNLSTLDVKKPVLPQASGGNPWAQYTQSAYQSQASFSSKAPSINQGTTVPYVQPPLRQALPQMPPAPQQRKHQMTMQVPVQVPVQQLQPHIALHVPPQGSRTPQSQARIPQSSVQMTKADSTALSPTLLASHQGNLIDMDTNNVKENRPKLNLELLDLDITGKSSTSRLTVDETGDDGDSLKVEVVPVRGPKPTRSPRTSTELQRLKFTMEELDLDDSQSPPSSRNSLSMKRNVSKQENRKSWFK